MAPRAAHAAEKIETVLDFSDVLPFWKRMNGILLYVVLSASFFSSLASGFDGVGSSFHLVKDGETD